MKEHDFGATLKWFNRANWDERCSEIHAIRHALTLAKRMQNDATIKRYMEIMRLSNVENAKAHIRAMIQAAQEGK